MEETRLKFIFAVNKHFHPSIPFVMEKRKKRILAALLLVVVGLGLSAGGTLGYLWFGPMFHPARTAYVYIDADDTADTVYHKLYQAGGCSSLRLTGLKWMARYRGYEDGVRTGRYAIRPGENAYHVLSRLMRGYQEPVDVVIGSVRTLDKLVRNAARQLMTDSASLARVLADSAQLATWGYDKRTLPALFIPNTYEMWWNVSAEDFFRRMRQEHERFWSPERRAKAQELGLTPTEVATLASIVEEETNAADEKPVVAGLYLNRLRRGMPLQADPTVRFAVGDFGRQRVTYADLAIESPYNTYLHPGLPPGPIRVATPEGLDAVLDYARHNYLYMCAKEDFSGRHNFASNYADHLRNARRYQQALNKRKIFQ